MKIDLVGKNAVVCGSTQGIGKATAFKLAECGATVTLIARDEQKLKEISGELNNRIRGDHKYIAADFNEPQMLKEALDKNVSGSLPVHILVNNSGGPKGGEITEAKTEDFITAFNRHLICNHILMQAVLPGMKKEKYGRIINVISTSVKQPIKGLGVSNTIRGAVASWAKTLSFEVAKFGITVNNVLPGSTKTERLFSLIETQAGIRGVSKEEVTNEYLKIIPAGRFAEAEELAYAIAFLASPYASYINGVSLPVDGGRTTSL